MATCRIGVVASAGSMCPMVDAELPGSAHYEARPAGRARWRYRVGRPAAGESPRGGTSPGLVPGAAGCRTMGL